LVGIQQVGVELLVVKVGVDAVGDGVQNFPGELARLLLLEGGGLHGNGGRGGGMATEGGDNLSERRALLSRVASGAIIEVGRDSFRRDDTDGTTFFFFFLECLGAGGVRRRSVSRRTKATPPRHDKATKANTEDIIVPSSC